MARTKQVTKVPKNILDQYVEPDEYFMVHENDPDLEPVKVRLPKPPELHLIEGYGLPAKEQFFKAAKYPKRLEQLEHSVKQRLVADFSVNKKNVVTGQKILEETLKILNEKKKDYQDEIKWVFDQIYHVHSGYWCFINGKPTFISGWHYMYITFWNLDIGLPDYRDRDRRWFLFAHDCYTSTENEKGEDLGFRTCYGFTYPKHRRDGATYKCLCIGYCINLWKKRSLFGIQSFNDDNASEHFREKLIPAWQKLHFFFKPMWDGSNNPAQDLSFNLPSNKVVGNETKSKINYATTASRSFYDGKKQMVHLSDENGKTLLEDVGQRHTVVKQTLSQGDGAIIHGFSMHPTTVADMEGGGGLAYHHLCNQSKFYERNELNGQTKSGLRRFFIPAYDGLEGFIGRYGESIIDTPTPEQQAFIRKKYGSKQHLQSTRDELLAAGDSKSLRDLREHIQLFPIWYDDCFRMSGGDIGFDTEILDKTISKIKRLKSNENPVEKGNFYYIIDGQYISAKEYVDRNFHALKKEGKVVWRKEDNGNFEISKKLPNDLTNLKYTQAFQNELGEIENVYYPKDVNNICCSADPFQFLDPSLIKMKENKDTMSEGGGAAFWKHDDKLDPDNKPINEWESCRFVCTYLSRPAHHNYYAEEMLMMCVYFGAYMLPENNIKLILSYFVDRGYRGYLSHRINRVTGKMNDVAGFASLKESKDDLFKFTRNHIKFHAHRERHLSLLIQWREIKHIKQMTDYDLLTAAGGCLLEANNTYSKHMERNVGDQQASLNIQDIALSYRY